jgi:cell division protein FtsA
MSGVRREVLVHLVTAATISVRNVVRSLNRAGLQVQDIVLEPLASAEAVLSDEEKELGILLIDLGGGTTDVALFRDGAVWHTSIMQMGSDHISNDVAVGFAAHGGGGRAQEGHGCALTALVREDEVISVPWGARRASYRADPSEIIQPRVEEIFTLVARELTARPGDAAAAGVASPVARPSCRACPSSRSRSSICPCDAGCPRASAGCRTWCTVRSTPPGWGLLSTGRAGDGAAPPWTTRGCRRRPAWYAN